MSDLRDPAIAKIAVGDPALSASDLSQIAELHPELRAQVAMHPTSYPDLLDWLESLGDPVLTAVVNIRRESGPGNTTPSPTAPSGLPDYVLPSAAPQAGWTAPPGSAYVAGSTPKKRSRLVIGLGAVVVALALTVTGFATRGFGLLPAGGAATPEEEALRVADKAVGLVNSFSMNYLLSNPMAAMGSLTSEYAPSEARLYSSFTNVDSTDLFGITGDTVGLLNDLAGSFKVETGGLEVETTMVTDDIAIVSFVGGTITVTADAERLLTALPKVPDVAAEQVAATAGKYGLHPAIDFEANLPAGWVDDAIDEVEENFPMTMDLAGSSDWGRGGVPGPSVDPSSPDATPDPVVGDNPLVVVREGGRWYLSSLLTTTFVGQRMSWMFDPDNPSAQASRTELERLLAVEPSRNDTPVAAVEGLAEAVRRADQRAVLKELPLAERRYAAFTGILSSLEYREELSVDYKFSELARNGQQAKLRIDELTVTDEYGSGFTVEDGSCLTSGGQSWCLADFLDSRTVADGVDYLREYTLDDGSAFEDATGIDPDDLFDKLELAAVGAVGAIDPDQLGIVAIQEDGSWFVSSGTTFSDLHNQLVAAIVAGLRNAEKG